MTASTKVQRANNTTPCQMANPEPVKCSLLVCGITDVRNVQKLHKIVGIADFLSRLILNLAFAKFVCQSQIVWTHHQVSCLEGIVVHDFRIEAQISLPSILLILEYVIGEAEAVCFLGVVSVCRTVNSSFLILRSSTHRP